MTRAGAAGRNPVLLARLLIVGEEEDLVLLDWSAHRTAHLILIQNLLHAAAVEIVKEAVGVQIGVAEKLPDAAVELIGARARNHVHVSAWMSAVAGVVSRGLDFEFLNRIGIGNSNAGVNAAVLRRTRIGRVDDGDAVHLVIVIAGIGAIHGDVLRALADGGGVVHIGVRAGGHGQELRIIAVAEWKSGYLLRSDRGSERRALRLQCFSRGFDGDLLGLCAYLERPVQLLRLGNI